MGTGKSTILSSFLHDYQIYDLDQVIEDQEKRTIPEIFQANGESYFRELEYQILKKTLNIDTPVMIATGGGIVTYQPSYQLLTKKTYNIWLDCSIDGLYDRLQNDQSRPLLSSQNRDELYDRITQLYNNRYSLYQDLSHLHIDTQKNTPAQIKYLIEVFLAEKSVI